MVWTLRPPLSDGAANSRRAAATGRSLKMTSPVSSQLLDQVLIGKAQPFGQGGEQPLGHLGSGSTVKVRAQNARRRGSGQHQADHAGDQHMGLSRSGIGRDEGRERWIGGAPLVAPGLVLRISHCRPSPVPTLSREAWIHSRQRDR